MAKIFQRISQVFHDLKQQRVLAILNLLRRQCKSFFVNVTDGNANSHRIYWRQPQPKKNKKAIALFPKLKRFRLWHLISSVVVFLLIVFSHLSKDLTGVAVAAATVQPPLSTRGSQIVDSTGTPVLLRGVNWFGFETDIHAPHGLWKRDYKDMLAQIKSLGYNIIRLPYSVNALTSYNVSGIDFNIGSNRDLQGKTPLEVMDLIIAEAQRQGLMILLDSHRLNDYTIPELWYGNGFTEADWIRVWTDLAERYKNQPNVIGADLKNEPHGQASWGTGNQATDWRLAAERAGNAIQVVNPNWLIVVEGVQTNVQGGQQLFHWWGGNLEGVKNYPVRLNLPKKLV
ncbi:MAG TPA: glycoside hydrolase family 5 protein, partial [Candidatus Sericytochromatia bacterium]